MAYIKSAVQAVSYSKFRPSPPTELIDKIMTFLKKEVGSPGLAVDVGCGSGQSTEVLAPYFQKVSGVDSSKEQLQQAEDSANKHANVSYRLGSAELFQEADESVDLVTTGQAVHWFDLGRFSAEVGRVLRPGGVLAIYGYRLPLLTINSVSLGDAVHSMIESSLGPYFPDGSRAVYFDAYSEEKFSKFPFSKQPAVRYEFLSTRKDASLLDLIGYISSMSGFQNYIKEHGEGKAESLLSNFRKQIAQQTSGDMNTEEVNVEITFPYFLLLSRKDKAC